MWQFIRSHIDPSTRFGETLFGLIMALGITGAVRIGQEKSSNYELFIAILGCNLAWGVVDGAMFVMLALFERGRKFRIVNGVLHAPTEEAAIKIISEELEDRLGPLMTLDEREQVYRMVLNLARRSDRTPPRIHREDLLGGLAVTSTILLATLPILIPFLVISKTMVAVRASNLIALAIQFWLGYSWGRSVGVNPLIVGAGVTSIGVILVLITIALGG